MAKRRKKGGARRGRMGSVGGSKGYTGLLMLAGGAIAGSSLAVYAGNMIGDKLPAKGKALGQVAAGAVVARASKTPFIQGVGIGMMVAGGTTLLKQTGMLSGADDGVYLEPGTDDYMGAAASMDDASGPLDMMSGEDEDAF